MPRVRVGENQALVLQGDITPEGGNYRNGMFAPTIDELSTQTLAAADEAGLLPSDLPIYDENGVVSEALIDEWEPYMMGVALGEGVPKYALAIVFSTIDNMGRDGIRNIGLSGISMDMSQTPQNPFAKAIISAVTPASTEGFKGHLVIYQPFYQYLSIPIIPAIPGRRTGLSVATYAVHHAIGHLVYAKLVYSGDLAAIGDFLKCGDWTKALGAENTSSSSYMQMQGTSPEWRRSNTTRFPTEACKSSPQDDFAESVALAFTHRHYLETVFPDRFDIVTNVLKGYGCTLE